MRPPHRILNRNHVHRLAAEHLQTHLGFKDYQRKTSAQVLWSLLLAAAAPARSAGLVVGTASATGRSGC
jgi:hypothetical protein